jgi:hypothetical protein
VRNETFYATIAQVLPTLLIAFAIEASPYLRDLARAWRVPDEMLSREVDEWVEKERRRSVQLSPPWARVTDEVIIKAIGRIVHDEIRSEMKSALRFQLLGVSFVLLLVGLTFIIGEVMAVAVLFWGTEATLPLVAGPTCLVTLVVTTLLVLLFPLYRAVFGSVQAAYPANSLHTQVTIKTEWPASNPESQR